MFGKAMVRGLLAVAVVCCAVAAQAVTIDTVPVGNAGNVADTAAHSGNSAGEGAVAYNYQIGKYEVTAGQYTEFLNAVGGVDTYALYSTGMSNTSYGSGIAQSGGGTVGNPYTYSVAANFANRPVNYVSYWDSCRFANWLDNGQPTGAQGAGTTETGAYTLTADGMNNNTIVRNTNANWVVTSEDEWYKAAYYKGGSTSAGYWDYPTKSNTAPGQDMADVSGNNANYYTAPYAYPIDSGKYTTVVGEFQNSASPYGTFDQGGNVWEWNESIPYSSCRGLRGGSFGDSDSDVLLASGRHYVDDPTDAGYSIGFRVASVPEPGSLIMTAMIAVTGLLYYRRKHA